MVSCLHCFRSEMRQNSVVGRVWQSRVAHLKAAWKQAEQGGVPRDP